MLTREGQRNMPSVLPVNDDTLATIVVNLPPAVIHVGNPLDEGIFTLAGRKQNGNCRNGQF